MQEGAVPHRAFGEGVHGDALHARHVAEGDGFFHEREDGHAAAWGAERPVFVVRRTVVPTAEAGGPWWGPEAGREVQVGECHQVGFEGGGVGLFEAGEGEGAGDEEAGGGVGRGGRLVRVEGAAVVFWGAELVAGRGLAWGGGCGRGCMAGGLRIWNGSLSAERSVIGGGVWAGCTYRLGGS